MGRGLTELRGCTAVVTGASSGIGKLLSLRLARAGVRLALTARRADQLEEVAAQVRAAGGEAVVLPCDVEKRDDVFAAAEAATRALGDVDLLVNNAGYGHHRSFLEWDIDDIERMMRVNYLGAVYWTKALLPRMVERRRGWLVFVASVAGKIGVPDESAYVASKFAMVGLAESISYEVEDQGVHVLTVCPGAIRTEFFDEEAMRRMSPTSQRMMVDPEPLVDAILAALRRGAHELTYPRGIASGYVVRTLAPRLMRYSVRRTAGVRGDG